MVGSDKTVKVRLILDAAQYDKGAAQASVSTKKLGADVEAVGTKSKGLEGSAKGAGGALKGMAVAGAAVAGTALVAFLQDAVSAAGDLEQSVGGVDAVFKGSADTIHEFGKNSAEAVGLSTNEFNQLVTVTGAMLKNKGLEDFADKSLQLVQIGADLSATYGGSAKEAVEALNAAMRGESDPIERYGISLNETAVNAELAAKGLGNLEGAALEQAKAQARIEIIMRQSADATGAFAREADTLQGQQQRLNAEWENAKASLGEALLPALTNVTSMMRGGLDVVLATAAAFEDIPGPVKMAVGALIALHLLKGPLGGFLSGTITQVKTLGTTLKSGGIAGGAKAAGSALMGAFGGPLGIAVGIGAAALTYWWEEGQKANAIADELRDTIDKTTGAFTDLSRETVKNKLLGDLSTEDITRMQQLGVNFDDLAQAALDGGPALQRAREQLDGMKNFDWLFLKDDADIIGGLESSLGRAADGAERAKVVNKELKPELEGVGDEAKAATPKLKGYEDIVGDVQTAAEEAEQAQKDLADAMLEVKAAAGDADAAAIAYQEALDTASASVKEHGRTLNINTEDGRANKTALLDLKDAALASAEANLKNGDDITKVKGQMDTARESFIKVAMQMNGGNRKAAEELATKYGLTRDSVDNLKGSMDKIPKEVVSELTVKTSQAAQAIRSFKLLYDSIGNKQVTLSAVYQTFGFEEAQKYRNRFAVGGFVSGPGTPTSDSIPARLSDGEYVIKAAAVAKYGRHVFDSLNTMRFAQGGYVSRFAQAAAPAIDYDRLTASMRGAGLTVNVSGGDPHKAARQVVDEWQWRVGR